MAAVLESEPSGGFALVVIVASFGGIQALSTVLAGLPENFPVPVAVVQHGSIAADPTRLERVLQHHTPVAVCTARTGQHPGAGITVVPCGHAATIDESGAFTVTEAVDLRTGDGLLATAAPRFGRALIAVVLTGRLRDGTEGARAVKRHGGRVLVEDPATATCREMPANAMATGCVDFVLALDHIAPALVALTMAPGGADLLRVPTPAWAQLSAQPS
jgi:two-component system chemotaxis response regulator CheB